MSTIKLKDETEINKKVYSFIDNSWFDGRASGGQLSQANFLRSCVGLEPDSSWTIQDLLYYTSIEDIYEILQVADCGNMLLDLINKINPSAIEKKV